MLIFIQRFRAVFRYAGRKSSRSSITLSFKRKREIVKLLDRPNSVSNIQYILLFIFVYVESILSQTKYVNDANNANTLYGYRAQKVPKPILKAVNVCVYVYSKCGVDTTGHHFRLR